jgi:hypothetical protein
MNTLETLKAARKLIELPEHWTQRGFARASQGTQEIDPNNPNATCWCSTGAIAHIQDINFPRWTEDMSYAFSVEKDQELEDFNDTHTHAEVLAAFDEAIARLEAK